VSYELEEGTGSEVRVQSTRLVVEIYEDTGEDLPVGYEPTTTKGGISGVAISQRGRRHVQESYEPRRTNIAFRDAIRRGLSAAQTYSAQMTDAAAKGQSIDLANSGFHLTDTLNDLWKCRDVREDDWGDLLNVLQTALAEEVFEKFSENQCSAIYKVITDHLSMGSVDADDLAVAVRILREAGFDPWKTISGKEVIEEDDE